MRTAPAAILVLVVLAVPVEWVALVEWVVLVEWVLLSPSPCGRGLGGEGLRRGDRAPPPTPSRKGRGGEERTGQSRPMFSLGAGYPLAISPP